MDGEKVDVFCNIPNVLDNRQLIENQGRIRHFFEVGMVLVEKIE